MIGKTISHYYIIEKLGGGGMGVVYKAKDLKLDRFVAIKFFPPTFSLDEDAKQRFIHEAKTASALEHNNICTIHEVNETEGLPNIAGGQIYLVMSCYEGETLKQKIDRGPLEIDEVINIFGQIVDGLANAHANNIIHRDIKPANIFITNDGVVKILDFGLAKVSGRTQLTKIGSTVGTVAYMSPEQTKGDSIDFRTDIWSLGVLLFEMLTGEQPFKGEYEQAIIYSILNEEPESAHNHNSEISSELLQLLNRAMDKDPSNRYQSMEEIRTDLRRFNLDSDSHKSLKEVPSEIKAKVLKYSKQRKWISVFVVFVLIILGWFILQKLNSTGEIDSVINEKSIAVMYFEDNTGDEEMQWLARGLPHMLITSLEQVPGIKVVGYQRLYDILKELGKEEEIKIDKSTATEIAKKAGVRTMLLGSIFKWGERVRVDYQLQDVNEGELIYANKLDGEDPFKIADNLASQVRQKFEISRLEKGIPKVEEITTYSQEAYKYYVKGKDYTYKGYWKEALENYMMAIKIDSTFAMAYLELSWIGTEAGLTWKEADIMLEKAVKYSNQTSERERLYILAQEAQYFNQMSKFRYYCQQLVEKFPFYGDVYYLLGSFYYNRREFNLAIKNFKKWGEYLNWTLPPYLYLNATYTELCEFDSVIYYRQVISSRFPNDILRNKLSQCLTRLLKGEYEKAISTANEMIEIKPDLPWAHRALGLAYFYNHEFNKAESEFCKVDSFGWYGNSLKLIPMVRMYQGKYKKAREYIFSRDESEFSQAKIKLVNSKLSYYYLQDNVVELRNVWKKNKDLFLNEFLSSRKTGDSYLVDSLIQFSICEKIYYGEFEDALKECEFVKSKITDKDLGGRHLFYLTAAEGEILFKIKDFLGASKKYEYLFEEEPRTNIQYPLSECLYKLKRFQEAKEMLISINRNYDSQFSNSIDMEFGYTYPRKYYLLGKVNEALDEKSEAIEAYQRFLDIWKEADADLPELIDAKQRLAKLKM